MNSQNITQQVYNFYQQLHFNEGSDIQQDLDVIKSGVLIEQQLPAGFKDYISSLPKGSRWLEAGCGIGWLSLSASNYFPDLNVSAIDLSDRALDRAQLLKSELTSSATFEKVNILEPDQINALGHFSAVVSIGVLHHTGDFPKAMKNVLSRVEAGGHILVGLYHKYKRRPLLDHFEKLKQNGMDEEGLRQEYSRLDRRSQDATRVESWFQDQVLHPHETQHTVSEILQIAGDDFSHEGNSITGKNLPDLEKLDAIEIRQSVLGTNNLNNGNYDPGFFLVHLKRKGS